MADLRYAIADVVVGLKMHPLFNTRIWVLLLMLTTVLNSHAQSIYIDASDAEEITLSSNTLHGEAVVEIQVQDPAGDQFTQPSVTSPADLQRMPFHQEVLEAAHQTSLAPALIHAVIAVESRHNPKAVSKKGAMGLMQLMPATAQDFGLSRVRLQDSRQNILVGAQYLKTLLRQFDGDLELALAAYNAGPAAVKKYHDRIPPFEETKRYVPKVLKYYRKYAS